jgi:hypothetical protein
MKILYNKCFLLKISLNVIRTMAFNCLNEGPVDLSDLYCAHGPSSLIQHNTLISMYKVLNDFDLFPEVLIYVKCGLFFKQQGQDCFSNKYRIIKEDTVITLE